MLVGTVAAMSELVEMPGMCALELNTRTPGLNACEAMR